MEAWMNRRDVQKALHARSEEGSYPWAFCTGSSKFIYSIPDVSTPVISVYKNLVDRAKEGSNLKMMVYSGDDDSICSTMSTQYWIWDDLGVTWKQNKFWQRWLVNEQTAGFTTEFDLGDTNSSFIFTTIHGTGHMVPTYKPLAGLEMFQAFLSDDWPLAP